MVKCRCTTVMSPEGTIWFPNKECPMHHNHPNAGWVSWGEIKKALAIAEAEADAKHGESEGQA